MARVDDDRQVRQFLEHGHRREVERIARVVVKRADAALAEDDLLVAAGHDVLGAHEQLLERAGQAALEQDGLAQLAKLTQEVEVLHIARADLNDVHILKQRQMLHAHDLGHDRRPVAARAVLSSSMPVALSP